MTSHGQDDVVPTFSSGLPRPLLSSRSHGPPALPSSVSPLFMVLPASSPACLPFSRSSLPGPTSSPPSLPQGPTSCVPSPLPFLTVMPVPTSALPAAQLPAAYAPAGSLCWNVASPSCIWNSSSSFKLQLQRDLTEAQICRAHSAEYLTFAV